MTIFGLEVISILIKTLSKSLKKWGEHIININKTQLKTNIISQKDV